MSENQTIDNYKMKVFLYKYTPPFTKVASPVPTTSDSFAGVDRYSVVLDESKYFSKYDITEYVSSYAFSQELDENTFSWSLILMNAFLTFNEINTNLLIEGPRLGPNNLTNLGQYEASSNDFATNTATIVQAKKNRGTTPDTMSVQAGAILTNKVGLRLQDLIQPYDMVSVFLYRGKVPVTELTGFRQKVASQNGRIIFNIDPAGTYTLTSGDLRIESVLLSPDPDDATKTLFSNEFNGFVMVKTITSEVGSVETVNISGNGISRLFGSTRRVIKQGVLQTSLYDVAVIDKPETYSAFTTNFANKTLVEVFSEFFKSIYGIKFAVSRDTTFVESDSGELSGALVFEKVDPQSSFYDISSIMVGNSLTTNLFTIPPFLLGLVMKRHGYAYRIPASQDALNSIVNQINLAKSSPTVLVSQFHFDPVTNQITTNQVEKSASGTVLDQTLVDNTIESNSSIQVSHGYRYPIFYSSELNQLRGYFLFFAEVLKSYAPDLKTPFEIIDEMKEKTFMEFFERPTGEFYMRAPQYNDTSHVIFSSTLDVINRNYTESATNLVTLEKVQYIADILNNILGNSFFSFMDGKLFLQYGFLEMEAESNPNASNNKTFVDEFTKKRTSGLIKYAEYMLRLHNAGLKTGTLVVGYDQRLVVGRTFFDEKHNKFGYITGVNKTVNAGGNVTVTINLTYVRDAYFNNRVPAGTSAWHFEHLLTLPELAQQFQQSDVATTPDPEAAPAGPVIKSDVTQ